MVWVLLIGGAILIWWLNHKPSTAQRFAPTAIPPPPKPPTADERAQAHLQTALGFAARQRNQLLATQREKLAWQQRHGRTQLAQLDTMTGIEFEQFLAGLLHQIGYTVTPTAVTGDYGADLILTRGSERIALQAKRYKDVVGVDAVQEVVAAKTFYDCTAAWVVTTARFTPNAKTLAAKNSVVLHDRQGLAALIGAATKDKSSS